MALRRGRGAGGCAAAMALAAGIAAPAVGQQEPRGASPLVLPRPGYEPPTRQVGPVALALSFDLSTLYDTNVYATSRNATDDALVVARPAVDATVERPTWAVHANGYAEVRRYLDVTRENAEQFGVAVDGVARLSSASSATAAIRFDRAVQLRADPEARAPVTLPPRRIDLFAADLGYTLQSGAFDFRLAPGFDRIDFLDPSERDRDFRAYRGSARISYGGAAPVAIFIEGYGVRRDFDLRRDFSGVNRDASTYGVLVGASREVSARLRGSMGVGVFRAEPADAAIRGFTGLAANGQVTWSPRARTQVTVTVFRGDVATVRSGASGRTDTAFSTRLDQEVRHNILLLAEAGWRRTEYRSSGISQDVFSGKLGGEYLLDRRFSLFAEAQAARRNATLPLDEFSRLVTRIGVRTRF